MTTREPDATLAPFVRDAAEQLERSLAAARPRRDFAAMMARACELTGQDEAAPDDADPADELAPVIPLPPRAEVDDRTALAPFTAALRAELDARLAERGMSGIPPLRTSLRRGRALAAAAAVAAAVVLLMFGSSTVLRQGDGPDGSAARDDGARALSGGDAERPGTPAQAPPAAPTLLVAPAPQLGGGTKVEVHHVPEDTTSITEGHAPKDRPPARRRVAGPSLEDEAQALWQRGELAAAEQKLREIVRIGGRGRRAELAYGDLFALVRQIRGADGQAAVWREYLARFPRGRFADDARAGLCQRAAAGERAACWRDYLEHHPDGAHRRRAEQAAAEAP